MKIHHDSSLIACGILRLGQEKCSYLRKALFFVSRNPNFQNSVGFFFFNLMTEDTEQQDSIAASEVLSWTSSIGFAEHYY